MKKLNIFLLGVLGLTVCSCQESIEPAPPQHNEQLPIVTIDDIQSQKAGVLASSATLTLENYRAEGTMIPVMELVSTENLPAGSEVEYKLELSSTSTFDKVVTLPTVPATANEDGSAVYSVEASAWNDAHLTLFGKSPKVKTVYYRVPMYLDVNGSDYRVAPTDAADPAAYYVASGSLEETCMDSGFLIEDAYYLLSNSTTWDLAEASKYAFYHNPDVSPYDDPVFTYVFNVSQEVLDANGGGCYWKIAPQSAVDSNDWATVLGTEYDGDAEPTGMLTTVDAGAGKIVEPGKYEITINMESMIYTVKHLASVLYIVGAPNGWNIDNDALYLSEKVVGSDVYTGTLKIEAGQFQFRLYSQLGDWDKNSIGAQNDDSGVEIAFNDAGVFEGDVFQGGVNCTSGKGSWLVNGWEGGAVEITVDLNTSKIEMKKVSVNSGIYLRGGMNGWGADPAYEFVLTDKVSVWEVADLTMDAGTEFKVADADWAAVNLGAGSVSTIVPGVAFPLDGGDNIKLEEAFSGKAVLGLSGGEYTLTLESK